MTVNIDFEVFYFQIAGRKEISKRLKVTNELLYRFSMLFDYIEYWDFVGEHLVSVNGEHDLAVLIDFDCVVASLYVELWLVELIVYIRHVLL